MDDKLRLNSAPATLGEAKVVDDMIRRIKQRKAVQKMYDQEDPLTLEDARDAGIAPWTNPIKEDFHIAVFKDSYPVTPGHLLFVPQYNTDALICEAFNDALGEGRRMFLAGECDGFNVGINIGKPAGQTVIWPHVHLIPRKTNDTKDPVGGVRNVIPFAGNYKRKVGWLRKLLRVMAR